MGILNLIALSYLATISIVVFIHLFNRRSNIIYVPSIIPWKEIKTDVVSSRLLRIDLLFLLQIFLIILLSLYLARPYLSSDILVIHGRNKIVVIDTSASMQTIEKDESRFDQAKKQILNLVDKMRSDDKMMIISAYSSSEALLGLTGDKELLRNSVEGLEPTETGTDLEGGISLALSYMENMKNSQLYIFTDQRIEECGSKIKELSPKSYRLERFGHSGANVAISSFDTFQDMFNEKDEAYLTMKNFSDELKDVKTTVYLKQDILMKRDITLEAREQKTVAIRNISATGVLKAQIETNDDLKADNTAFGIIKERKKLIDILLVTNSSELKREFQRLEEAFSQMKVKTVSIGEYDPAVMDDYDIGIFHRFVPDKQPGINSLFIAPNFMENDETPASVAADESRGKANKVADVSQNSKLWSSYLMPKGIIQNTQILDWDNTHPAMKYLEYLDNVKTYNALLFEPPKDARVLIYASGEVSGTGYSPFPDVSRNDLPLAFTTKLGNKRAIVAGLDLAEFSYSDTDNLPILIMTLNMIQWLSPLGGEMDSLGRSNLTINDQLKTGDLYPVHDPDNFEGLSIIRSDGRVLPISDSGIPEIQSTDTALSNSYLVSDKSANYAVIKHTGIYTAKWKDKDEIFVVNLFNESESNIKPQESDPNGSYSRFKTTQTSNNVTLSTAKHEINELSRHILYFVPLLLFVEWIYSFVRKT